MAVHVKRKTKNLEKLVKKLNTLKKNSVSTGYFSEQGKHPDADISYAEMMNLHEYGFDGNLGYIPSRPVRSILTVNLKTSLPKDIVKNLNHYLYHNGKLGNLLDIIGRTSTREAHNIFGSTQLRPNSQITVDLKESDKPLIDTGLLQGNWSWKTTVDNTISSYGF